VSVATAELVLILKAQNLATGAMTAVETSLGSISAKAKTVAGDVKAAFKGLGFLIAGELANLGADILAGKDIKGDLIGLGSTFAFAIVSGMSVTLIPAIVTWLAESATFAPVVAAAAGQGTIVGRAFAVAMAAGVALALPALLLTAILESIEIAKKLGVGAPQKNVGHYDPKADHTPKGNNNQGARKLAAGGWAGLNGPELAWIGEKGPEYVTPAGPSAAGRGGFTIQGISEREIIEMVDRGLYFKLRRSGTGG
jgi:hypothetical protein